MNVGELLELLRGYDATAEFQINVSDGNQTLAFDSEQDEEYGMEAFVLNVNLDEGYYIEKSED